MDKILSIKIMYDNEFFYAYCSAIEKLYKGKTIKELLSAVNTQISTQINSNCEECYGTGITFEDESRSCKGCKVPQRKRDDVCRQCQNGELEQILCTKCFKKHK
jgi:hypothetical protein